MLLKTSQHFEDTKEVIRNRLSMDRQYSGQTKKDKKINNGRKTRQKTNDWVTQTLLKTDDDLRCSRRVGSSVPLVQSSMSAF